MALYLRAVGEDCSEEVTPSCFVERAWGLEGDLQKPCTGMG